MMIFPPLCKGGKNEELRLGDWSEFFAFKVGLRMCLKHVKNGKVGHSACFCGLFRAAGYTSTSPPARNTPP